jgi:hypothetical protein
MARRANEPAQGRGGGGETARADAEARRLRNLAQIESCRLALDFIEPRGWRFNTAQTFDLITLSRGGVHDGRRGWGNAWEHMVPGRHHDLLDHPYWFKSGKRAAAVAAHLYGREHVVERCRALAARYWLDCEIPDYPSWHNDGAMLVVYVGPAGRGVSPPARSGWDGMNEGERP